MSTSDEARAPTNAPPPGRRERNKHDKQTRIHAAAADLFAERGYSAVTTQDIADRADVAIGTLFRYASSKAELLLMVFNDDWRRSLERHRSAVPADGDPTGRIMALLGPLIVAGTQKPENTAVYQREILFGEPDGRYRAEALALVDQLEASIGAVLRSVDEASPHVQRIRPGTDPVLAARSLFSVLHMELIRSSLGRESAEELPRVLHAEIDLVIHGIMESAGRR
ncbi:MAG: TetR/AcrR family transcriptional regulator [Ramlibacter sp.]|nr:TetR/AcrR family transcriptional regulator [Cryobacterium sp.]